VRPLAVLLVACATGPAADWPGWRGPTGLGLCAEKDLPLVWGGKDDKNVRWKVPLPGIDAKAAQDENQSSPIVFGDRLVVTASYWPGDKKDPKAYPEHHVVCYHIADGKLLWDVKVEPGPWLLSDLRGGYTAPTPAADAERIYVVFGSAVIAALDHDGKPVWRKVIDPYKFDVCFGASPVLFGDTVILQCDQVDRGSRMTAFDRKTGDVKWEEKRPTVGFSHSTPVAVKVGDRPQLLISASNAVQGADPVTGKLLWWCAAKGDTVTPVFGGGLVYCDSGRGGPGVAVDPTGTGDVSKTHARWRLAQVPEAYSSPVVAGEYLYRLVSPETVRCVKLSSGDVVFSERLPGVATSASPIATADGRVYLASAGKSFVLKAGPTAEVLEVNDLGDGGHASPAIAGGRLYLKGRRNLYCVGSKE
jgi:outer membrane protein assembly factor BamB